MDRTPGKFCEFCNEMQTGAYIMELYIYRTGRFMLAAKY